MPTAIVSGSAHGIGLAIVRALAARDYTVIANYHSEKKNLAACIQQLPECRGRVIPMQGDVRVEADCQALVRAAQEETGRVDLLVNNAGITKDGLLLRMSEDDFQNVWEINAKGSFLMMKHAAKVMLKQREGCIINMSSVSGIMGNPGQINYAAAKAALIAMTKTAAKELASAGIRVNAIAPGFIRTRMTDALPEKIISQAKAQIPLKDFGTAEDIAAALCFLASADARYITGVTLAVDGGISI